MLSVYHGSFYYDRSCADRIVPHPALMVIIPIPYLFSLILELLYVRTNGIPVQHFECSSCVQTQTYPPFTPINCRFFLVVGEPGSPSAFRFIIDLRVDWGEAEEKRRPIHL